MNTPQKKTPPPSKAIAVNEQLSFLPPPPFSPIWPKRGTLTDKALTLFMAGRMLTHPDFQAITQSWRLGAYVGKLREMGWPITTIEILAPTDENPNRIIALYHLAARYVAEALALQKRC